MFGIGFGLFVFGVVAFLVRPPPLVKPYTWNIRDAFSTIPINLGCILMLASAVVVLWRAMP